MIPLVGIKTPKRIRSMASFILILLERNKIIDSIIFYTSVVPFDVCTQQSLLFMLLRKLRLTFKFDIIQVEKFLCIFQHSIFDSCLIQYIWVSCKSIQTRKLSVSQHNRLILYLSFFQRSWQWIWIFFIGGIQIASISN